MSKTTGTPLNFPTPFVFSQFISVRETPRVLKMPAIRCDFWSRHSGTSDWAAVATARQYQPFFAIAYDRELSRHDHFAPRAFRSAVLEQKRCAGQRGAKLLESAAAATVESRGIFRAHSATFQVKIGIRKVPRQKSARKPREILYRFCQAGESRWKDLAADTKIAKKMRDSASPSRRQCFQPKDIQRSQRPVIW